MPASVQEKRQPFSKGVIRFLEYCCCLGIHVFRLLFARGLRIPPYLRCCAYTWPCAMRRVPGRLRTCAERRLGACPCRLGYGNLADCSSPRSTFVADINLSIPKERREEWNAGHGEECGGGGSGRTAEENRKSFKRRSEPGGTVSFGLTNP